MRDRAGKERICSWFDGINRQLHLDSHFGDYGQVFQDFDAEAAAQTYADAGFELVTLFAKCLSGYSYYPTQIGTVHPGLGADYTGELSAALRKRGIRRILYFMMATEQPRAGVDPEWSMVADERLMWSMGETTQTMCFNSPHVDEVGLPQMAELIERYEPDGFFVDLVVHQYVFSNCRCRYCREQYDRDIGGEIPTSDDDPRIFAYRHWMNRRLEGFIDKVSAAVAAVREDVGVIFNMGWTFGYPVRPPAHVPHVTWDTPVPAVGNYSSSLSLQGRYLSTMPDVPFSLMNTRGNNWLEYSLREEEAFLQECALVLASGGKTFLSDIPYPSGNPDAAVYELFGRVNQRTQALASHLSGSRPVADIAVLHTAESAWSKAPLQPKTGWPPSPAYHSVGGAHKALSESHNQFTIVNGETLIASLSEYGALVLSDQRILNADEVEAICGFVHGGGALLATHETGTRDADNQVLDDFVLADVLGVRRLAASGTANCYLRATDELRDFGVPAMDVQAGGAYTRVETTTAEQVLGLVPPYEGIATGTPPPALAVEGPGVNDYSMGKAIYIASDLLGAYYRMATPAMRKLFSWALSRVYLPESRQIAVESAPLSVEMFCRERDGERFVHLINYGSDRRDEGMPQTQDFPTVHGIRVRLRADARPKCVTLVPEGEQVAFEWSGGWASFEALPLTIHHVYQVELS